MSTIFDGFTVIYASPSQARQEVFPACLLNVSDRSVTILKNDAFNRRLVHWSQQACINTLCICSSSFHRI